MPAAFSGRVLLTGDTAGGVWTFVMELASRLNQRGVQVYFAALGPTLSDCQREEANSVEGLNWLWRRGKLEWMEDAWRDVEQAGLWLSEWVSEIKPQLVHLNTLSYGESNFGVPVVQTVHSCVCSWWAAVKQSALPEEWSRYRRHVKSSLAGCECLAAPSHSALREIATQYGVDSHCQVAIYNGVDSPGLAPTERQPLILSVGRLWDEAKNVATLTNIASELPWPVLLAGKSSDNSVSSTKSTSCQLLGELSRAELATWYRQASIYVSPAKYEPFGLAALEAALGGCALVLGDIPSLREVWGDAAIFVPPDDSHGLKAALLKLIADASMRREMAQRARRRAGTYTADRMTDGYVDLYRRAMVLYEEKQLCTS